MQQTIGVVMTFIGGYYFRDLITGIQEVVEPQGYQVLVYRGTAADILESDLMAERVAGWISVIENDGLAEFERRGWPVVMVSAADPALACPAVLADSHGGEYAAVSHLIEHGHTRIAYIGYRGHEDMRQRYAAYEQALSDHGIAVDEGLVVNISSYEITEGADGFRELAGRGVPFTAIVAGNDLNALGILSAAQAAGYRVPEDIALIGFDDINDTQYTNPPLTTVRQPVDALGRAAGAALIGLLSGDAQPAARHMVPTTLMRRRSCGCDQVGQLHASQPGDPAGHNPAERQASLERRIIQIVLLSNSAEPDQAPAPVRRAVATLAGGMFAEVSQGAGPSSTELSQAWHAVFTITTDLEAMSAIITALEEAGAGLVATAGADPEAALRLQRYLKRARVELLRAQMAVQRRATVSLEEQVSRNYQISLLLLATSDQIAHDLSWLSNTPASRAFLALWEPGERPDLRLNSLYNATPEQARLAGQRYPAMRFPPAELPGEPIPGDISVIFPLHSAERRWGVMGLSSNAQSWIFADIKNVSVWASLLTSALERGALLGSLISQQESLQASYEREHLLAETVRELGSPIIPLLPGVLMVPLIGGVDSHRIEHVIDLVLHTIERQRAGMVLIDVTGVPVIDTQVAAGPADPGGRRPARIGSGSCPG